jgi:hypothetical protein
MVFFGTIEPKSGVDAAVRYIEEPIAAMKTGHVVPLPHRKMLD